MARFDFQNLFFRWSDATSAQLNNSFNRVRDWVNNSLSTDSLKPGSVEARHTAQPMTFVLSDHNSSIGSVVPGDPLAEVTYTASGGLASHKIIVMAWTWIRRRASNAASNFSATAEDNRICWYDSLTGNWNLADYSGSEMSFLESHEDAVWGHDKIYPAPLPGGSYTVGGLLFENGGCQAIVSVLSKNSDIAADEWPPLGQDVTKFGVFGQDNAAADPRDGKATIWLFAEDNGQ